MEVISISTEYYTLGQFLKHINVISSGGQAKFFLLDEPVLVNNVLEARRGRKLYHNDIIFVLNQEYQIQCV